MGKAAQVPQRLEAEILGLHWRPSAPLRIHPTVFLFIFHSGRTGIYLKFELPPETTSKPKLPHTDTQPIWLIISGVSVAHTQNFSLVSHFHVTSGLPQAQREAVYEKV